MSKQIGARYLHKCKTRKDKSFNGIVAISNRVRTRTIQPSKQIKLQGVDNA